MAPRLQDGGTLLPDALYVERQADRELHDCLRAGSYAWVLAPRQMGKSSLKRRTADRLARDGTGIVDLDLNEMAAEGADADSWTFGLMDEIARSLDLPAPDAFWTAHERLAPIHRWSRWVRQALVPALSGPVVIFIDEIDTTLRLPFSRDDFFASIRAFYDDRREIPALTRLAFCLVGVASPAELMRDPLRSPFNVGVHVRLEDFSEREMDAFLPVFAAMPEPEATLRALHGWTSGHPYMTQRLARRVLEAGPSADIDGIVRDLFLARGRAEDPNLSYALKRLSRPDLREHQAEIRALYARLLAGESVPARSEDELQLELKLAGMAAEGLDPRGQRVLHTRNRIFREVFDESWLQAAERDRFLADTVNAWVLRGRPEALLLRDQLLDEAMGRLGGDTFLTALERDFIEASRAYGDARRIRLREAEAAHAEAERRRAQVRGQRLLLGLVLTLLLGVISAFVAYILRERELGTLQDQARAAEEQATLAELREREADVRRGTAENAAVEAETRRAEAEAQFHEADLKEQVARAELRQAEIEVRKAFAREGEAKATAATMEGRQKEAEAAVALAHEGLLETARRLYEAASTLSQTPGAELDALRTALRAASILGDDAGSGSGALADAIQARRAFRTFGSSRGLAEAFSPDGRSLALAERKVGLALWDLDTEAARWRVPLQGEDDGDEASAIVFSPGGDRLLVHFFGGSFQLLDAQDGHLLWASQNDAIKDAGHPFDGAGNWIYMARNGSVFRVDTRSGREEPLFDWPRIWVTRLTLSPDDRLLAATEGQFTRIWDIGAGELRAELDCGQRGAEGAAFSPDGRRLAVACGDMRPLLYGIPERRVLARPEGHRHELNAVAFTRDGRELISASQDGTIRLWDSNTGEARRSWAAHRGGVGKMLLSPDGLFLATFGGDQKARLWSLSDGRLHMTLSRSGASIRDMLLSPDGRSLLFATHDLPPLLWELGRSGARLVVQSPEGNAFTWAGFQEGNSGILAMDHKGFLSAWSPEGARQQVDAMLAERAGYLRLSPNGHTLLVYGGSCEVGLSDLRNPSTLLSLGLSVCPETSPFSADGARFVLPLEKEARVYASPSGTQLASLDCGGKKLLGAALSPDGARAALLCEGRKLQIWEVDARRLLKSADNPMENNLCWSPDGRFIAGTAGFMPDLFDADTLTFLHPFTSDGPGDTSSGSPQTDTLVFSPDGRRVLLATREGTARVYDASTGRLLDLLEGHLGVVWFADFSRDGRRAVTASMDGTARVWDLSASLPQGRAALLYEACRLLKPFKEDYGPVDGYCGPILAAPPPEGWP